MFLESTFYNFYDDNLIFGENYHAPENQFFGQPTVIRKRVEIGRKCYPLKSYHFFDNYVTFNN